MSKVVKGIFLLLITVNFYLGCEITTGNIQSDQWKLKQLARKGTGGDAYTIKVEGDYCYVSCGYSGFRIFDISDLSNPTEVAYLPQLGSGYAHQFILERQDKNNIAYIGNGYGGIWIINCTDPENPSEIIEYSHDYSWDLQIVDDIIYAGNGHISAQESITITNISAVTNPNHIKTILTDDGITDLQRVENRLYAACSREGLLIFDISNKTDPKHLGTYVDTVDPDIYLITFEVVGNYAFACYYEYGIQILDISNPSQITKVSELTNSSSNCYSINVIDDLAYVSDITGGIQVINVSILTDPVEQYRYQYDSCGTNDIFKREDVLFVADRNLGFIIFQIGDDFTTPFGIDLYFVIVLFISFIFARKRLYSK
ncbi:MAG: LVIVD repeat-containing protein [Candidatus Hodarchaeales archaeon]|jgi:hypothetical protein